MLPYCGKEKSTDFNKKHKSFDQSIIDYPINCTFFHVTLRNSSRISTVYRIKNMYNNLIYYIVYLLTNMIGVLLKKTSMYSTH